MNKCHFTTKWLPRNLCTQFSLYIKKAVQKILKTPNHKNWYANTLRYISPTTVTKGFDILLVQCTYLRVFKYFVFYAAWTWTVLLRPQRNPKSHRECFKSRAFASAACLAWFMRLWLYPKASRSRESCALFCSYKDHHASFFLELYI